MKYVIPLELIELEENNYHLAIKCRFEDDGEGLWVIDSGASKTVFNVSLTQHYDLLAIEEDTSIRSAGIGSDQLDTRLGILHSFSLGTIMVNPLMVALIDLSNINSLYYHATEREICGLIGSDFLLENNAIIDYSKLRLVLSVKKRK
jgi:hypothetical protein